MLKLTDRIKTDLLRLVEPEYTRPYKKYHNIEHISTMLTLDTKYFGETPDELWLAIVFHDIVYVPGAPADLNETASAMLLPTAWFSVVEEHMDKKLYDAARRLIMATSIASHCTGRRGIGGRYGNRIRDLDLFSLALPINEFMQQQAKIRAELWPIGMTAADHAKWLTDFAKSRKSKGLFLTPELKQFNRSARSNIETYAALYCSIDSPT